MIDAFNDRVLNNNLTNLGYQVSNLQISVHAWDAVGDMSLKFKSFILNFHFIQFDFRNNCN